MALGDPYATLAELKLRVGGVADAAQDAALNNALAVATTGINGVCGRQFNKTTVASARVYYPRNQCLAVVDDFHTTTDLVIATDSGSSYGNVIASTGYELHPLNGVVDGETGWPYWEIHALPGTYFPWTGRAPLQVTAQWGWTAVPPGVKEACLLVAEETYALKDTRFGVGGVAEWGTIRVRSNPMAMSMIHKFILDPVKMA
ncbi:MAG TPA: hypothetical protein VFC00_30710 [Micromonosporaceae bacterium]|nr:hypothetical protein [Micromonosporaceae bacterium]